MHEKPRFTNNQHVAFDFGNGTSGTGFIKGLAFEHIIDGWIVEVEESQGIDKAVYPWSCIVVTHTLLKPIESVELGPAPWEVRPELYECVECSAKPGTPTLCQRCLAARRTAGGAWIGTRNRFLEIQKAKEKARDDRRREQDRMV